MVVEVVAVEAVEAGVEHVVAGAGVQGPPRPPATPTALPGLRLGSPTVIINHFINMRQIFPFSRVSCLPTSQPSQRSCHFSITSGLRLVWEV